MNEPTSRIIDKYSTTNRSQPLALLLSLVILSIASLGFTFNVGTFWRGPVGGPAACSPDDVSGLTFWIDGTDLTTLFQDIGGTNPVTANGQSVGAWANKKAPVQLLVAPFGDSPTWLSTGIGGLGAVNFSDKFLFGSVNISNYVSATTMSIFLVGVADDAGISKSKTITYKDGLHG